MDAFMLRVVSCVHQHHVWGLRLFCICCVDSLVCFCRLVGSCWVWFCIGVCTRCGLYSTGFHVGKATMWPQTDTFFFLGDWSNIHWHLQGQPGSWLLPTPHYACVCLVSLVLLSSNSLCYDLKRVKGGNQYKARTCMPPHWYDSLFVMGTWECLGSFGRHL